MYPKQINMALSKLIMLPDNHYVIVNDSKINEGDWVGYPNLKNWVPIQYLGGDLTGGEKKITHSNKPLEEDITYRGITKKPVFCFFTIKPLYLSEILELIRGYNLGTLAELHSLKMLDEYKSSNTNSFFEGFKTAMEITKDKVFTIEDIEKAMIEGLTIDKFWERCCQSLQPKTEWDVEFDEQGKLKLS